MLQDSEQYQQEKLFIFFLIHMIHLLPQHKFSKSLLTFLIITKLLSIQTSFVTKFLIKNHNMNILLLRLVQGFDNLFKS